MVAETSFPATVSRPMGWHPSCRRHKGPTLLAALDTLHTPSSLKRHRKMPPVFVVSQAFNVSAGTVVVGHVADGVIAEGATLWLRSPAINTDGDVACAVTEIRAVGFGAAAQDRASRQFASCGDIVTLCLAARTDAYVYAWGSHVGTVS